MGNELKTVKESLETIDAESLLKIREEKWEELSLLLKKRKESRTPDEQKKLDQLVLDNDSMGKQISVLNGLKISQAAELGKKVDEEFMKNLNSLNGYLREYRNKLQTIDRVFDGISKSLGFILDLAAKIAGKVATHGVG